MPISNYFRFFQRNETAAHHLVEGGSNSFTFSSLSTISMTIGRSIESRKIFAVWNRLDLPKPIGPRKTVAPARCISRAFQDNGLVERSMLPTITFTTKIRSNTASCRDFMVRFLYLGEFQSRENMAHPHGRQDKIPPDIKILARRLEPLAFLSQRQSLETE